MEWRGLTGCAKSRRRFRFPQGIYRVAVGKCAHFATAAHGSRSPDSSDPEEAAFVNVAGANHQPRANGTDPYRVGTICGPFYGGIARGYSIDPRGDRIHLAAIPVSAACSAPSFQSHGEKSGEAVIGKRTLVPILPAKLSQSGPCPGGGI